MPVTMRSPVRQRPLLWQKFAELTTGGAASNTGGSNGATMRFSPESNYDANAGLKVARDLLEPVKAKFPWLSYADLYTLGGVVAVEEMGGATRTKSISVVMTKKGKGLARHCTWSVNAQRDVDL